MKESSSMIALEILAPKGRLEFEVASDSELGALRTRIAQELQTDPVKLSLIAEGKFAPAEGPLTDFLGSGRDRARIFAVWDTSRDAAAERAITTRAIDLMPSHIREDMDSGGSRFTDMVESWERRMREDPMATSRQLRSPETRELFDSLRVPRIQPGSVAHIGAIDLDAFITPPQNQKLLQEVIKRQQESMADANSQSGLRGIEKDIRFYHQMMTDSLAPLMQPPKLPSTIAAPPPPPSKTGSTSMAAREEPPAVAAAPPRRLEADSAEIDALLERTKSASAVEAFKQARQSLRLLQDEAPELLRALVDWPQPEAATRRIEPQQGSASQQTTVARFPGTGSDLFFGGGGDGGGLNEQAEQMLANMIGMRESLREAAGLDDAAGDGDSGSGATNASETEESLRRKYAVQLKNLSEMGFTDEAANLGALRITRGDMNAALDRLPRDTAAD